MLGGGSLGNSWLTFDEERKEFKIDTKDTELASLKNDELVIVTIKVALVDSADETELYRDEL